MRRALAILAALLAAAVPAAPQQPQPGDPRPELESMQRALDRSVGAVSRPATDHVFGGTDSRGFLVAGYGAVFVLAPRALPVRPGRDVLLPGFEGAPFERGMQLLESGLQGIESEQLRQQMESGLAELRRMQQRRARAVEAAREDLRRAREHEQQAQRDVRERRRQLDQQAERREAELKELLDRAEAYQLEAERAREAAEQALRKALAQAQGEMHVRVGSSAPRARVVPVPATPAAPTVAPAPPAPPLAPAAPPAPAPPPPPAGTPASATAPPAPVPDLMPPAPPWSFWFDDEEDDARTADDVVSSVGAAVTNAVEAHAGRLRAVRPDESVVVLVDFVPRASFVARRRASRTLIVRVRKKELEDRQAGRITADELRRRVELIQY